MNFRKLHKCLLLASITTSVSYFANGQQVALDWAKQFSGASQDEYASGTAAVLDQNRNVYTAGSFSVAVDFDPGPGVSYLYSAAGITFNAFVSKVDAQGNFVWAKRLGGISGTEAFAIATDASANVYTTGYFQDTADFDPGPGTFNLGTGSGDGSIFISKLDSAGNFVWAKKIGDGGWDVGSSIVADRLGSLYISGQFDGTVDFDPGAGISNLTAVGDNDVFVVKLDQQGNFIWAKRFGGLNGYLENKSITVDSKGDVYSTGTFTGTLDFNPGTAIENLTSSGWNSIYISKLTGDGNFVFSKKIGGQFSSSGNVVKVDENSNIYVAGYFSSTVDFDPGPAVANLSSSGPGIDFDIFVAKFDSIGNYAWAKRIGGTSFEDCKGLDLDAQGNVYTTGYFSGTTDFDPGTASFPLTSLGSDIFVSKLDNSGNFVWAKQIGRATAIDNVGYGFSINIDKGANIYTTGKFTSSMDFDPDAGTTIMDAGLIYSDDAFVHKLMCIDTTSSSLQVNIDSCTTYTLNGFTYTHSGTYIQRIPNAVGCDSIITLNLSISNEMNILISANNLVLQTSASYVSYQWLRDGNIISGATNSTHTVTANGNYSLVATNSLGCTDTSNVLNIGNATGIDDNSKQKNNIVIYPNPTKDVIFVKAPVNVELVLTSIEGKVLLVSKTSNSLRIGGLTQGLYFLRVLDKNGNIIKVERIIKE